MSKLLLLFRCLKSEEWRTEGNHCRKSAILKLELMVAGVCGGRLKPEEMSQRRNCYLVVSAKLGSLVISKKLG